MDSFRALLIETRDGKVVSGFVRLDERQLDSGNAIRGGVERGGA